jgi:uncharacterized membrane protein
MIGLLVYIALVGLLAWALVYFIPMPPKFATGIYVLAAIFVLLIILQAFGLLPAGVPSLR